MHKLLSSTPSPEASDVVARGQGDDGVRVAVCAAADTNAAFGAGIEIALANIDGAPKAPEWVQLFPAGPDIIARGGRRRWTLSDPQRLVEAFARNQADLPFDIEHAQEIKAPKGEEAPAQGWMKELQVRPDRTVWARVDWTAAGEAAVTSKAYRYVSPAFLHTADGEILALKSAALTNQPALVLPALARSEGDLSDPQTQDPSMSLLNRLVAALGLASTATDDDVVNAVTGQVALARDARDPAKLVPAADLQTALARAVEAETKLAERDAAEAEAKAVETVDGAIAAGKVAPASRDHWLGLARTDLEMVTKTLEATPALLKPTPTDKKVGGDGQNELGLTAQQVALCRDNGWDVKTYAEQLKEEGR